MLRRWKLKHDYITKRSFKKANYYIKSKEYEYERYNHGGNVTKVNALKIRFKYIFN